MATLTGTIKDAAGAPLSGVTVRVFNSTTNALAATVTSNASGVYTATVPAGAQYFAVAYKAGTPAIGGATNNLSPSGAVSTAQPGFFSDPDKAYLVTVIGP